MDGMDGWSRSYLVPRRGGEVVAHWLEMSALTPNYRSNEANRSGSSSSREGARGKSVLYGLYCMDCMVESIKLASNGLDQLNARSCPIPDRNALVAGRCASGICAVGARWYNAMGSVLGQAASLRRT
jgi:hypothetical protein